MQSLRLPSSETPLRKSFSLQLHFSLAGRGRGPKNASPRQQGSAPVRYPNQLFSRLLLSVLASAAFVGTPAVSLADGEAERTELARLIHEIERLELVIEQAEQAAESAERVHFQYAWLRTDLARVKAGIREYLESVPITPRTVIPLAGDYVR